MRPDRPEEHFGGKMHERNWTIRRLHGRTMLVLRLRTPSGGIAGERLVPLRAQPQDGTPLTDGAVRREESLN